MKEIYSSIFTGLCHWQRLAARPAGLMLGLAIICLGLPLSSPAAIPTPEQLLPQDTLVLLTVPNCAQAGEVFQKLPETQLLNDPAMRPFRDHFLARWQEEFVGPLERELQVKWSDYTQLLRGQLTLAVTQNGWQGQDDAALGVVLLLDAKDKSEQLKKNLAEVRKKWVDSGRTLRTEKIRNIDFTILTMADKDVPKTWRKLFPPAPEVQELGAEKPTKPAQPKPELAVGQFESLLLIGNSVPVLEKILVHLQGGTLPALGELAAYQANHQGLFRDASCYGWINVKAFLKAWIHSVKPENPEAPNPFDIQPEKILAATGLTGLNTLGASLQQSSEGQAIQLFLGVPEADRQGLLKIFAGEPRETIPPPFVPADAVKFQRWRIDGQKTWATFQKMVSDISPAWVSGINFLIETANTAAKDKDPGFDLKKNLIGNLGDDFIRYEKAPRGTTPAELDAAPALYLVGSPNAEQLALSLKSILIYLSQQAGAPPEEREFLGRKIFSVPLVGSVLPVGTSNRAPGPRTLSYAASGGYVALSTDVSLLEEYLRSATATGGKSLRETAGLAEAAQRVTSPCSSAFGYVNQAETMRATFESLRKSTPSDTNAGPNAVATLLPSAAGLAGTAQNVGSWMNFALLPPFDQVSRYFYFTVYGSSATTDGLTFKLFAPTPPALRSKP